MIMSPLIAFLIVFVLLLIALIKLKVTPSVGLFGPPPSSSASWSGCRLRIF